MEFPCPGWAHLSPGTFMCSLIELFKSCPFRDLWRFHCISMIAITKGLSKETRKACLFGFSLVSLV
jgi:hypothetical protein